MKAINKVSMIAAVAALAAAAAPAWSFNASVQELQGAIAQYRTFEAAGGWPSIPAAAKLKKGESSEHVATLRTRLAKTGDLDASLDNGDTLFDDAVEQAVMSFQKRHGEDGDGVIGPETLAALNVSAAQRLRQLELNVERLSKAPHSASGRTILVNIPDYTLHGLENGKTVLQMRVVLGKDQTSTPAFSDALEYVYVNPYWNVPTGIGRDELIPKIRKDPGYLAKKGFEVVKGDGDDAKVIDPGTIDWNAASFPYRIRQKPGPMNALGRIKFMMPNKEDIYLHDTPEEGLFDESERAYSHGCIRVEKPLDLAEFVFRGSKWTRGEIAAAIDSGKQSKIPLPAKVPVHLLYVTAWVEDGKVHFREDVYSQDSAPRQAEKTAGATDVAG